MKPRSAKKAFLARLQEAGRALASLRPGEGVEAMLAFYTAERADGCDIEEDGDMLLIQWGVHDWGDGESFTFEIVRQLMTGDDAIRQLRLTFRYDPTAALGALGDGNRWCDAPGRLAEFRRFILASPAFAAVERLDANAVTLELSLT
jgi:hypothetical protein